MGKCGTKLRKGKRWDERLMLDMAKRILVVDDDPDIVLALTDRLIDLGFWVTAAGNGAEGMKIIEQGTVDGVILDLNMPVMDGMTMLTHVRQRFPRMPVIIMSADENKQRLIRGTMDGATDYIVKPINVDLLIEKWMRIFWVLEANK